MDPPVPAAQGKGSWAGSLGVALPGAPDRWAGCPGGCGAAWGWSSGALPGGVLACGCPVRTGLGSPWPLLLPAASPSSLFRVRPQLASPSTAGRVQLPGLWGPRGRSPPVPFPLQSPSLEGPRPGMSTGTPSGRGAPSPQSPGSPVPQGSAGPHACRTAGHQAGDGTAVHGHVRLGVCGLRGTLGPCPVPPVPSAALASPPCPSRCGQGQTRWPCSVSAVGPGLEPVEGQAVRSSGKWGQRPPPPPGSRNRRGDGKRGRGSQRQGRWLAARGPPSGTSVCGARQMPGAAFSFPEPRDLAGPGGRGGQTPLSASPGAFVPCEPTCWGWRGGLGAGGWGGPGRVRTRLWPVHKARASGSPRLDPAVIVSLEGETATDSAAQHTASLSNGGGCVSCGLARAVTPPNQSAVPQTAARQWGAGVRGRAGGRCAMWQEWVTPACVLGARGVTPALRVTPAEGRVCGVVSGPSAPFPGSV